MAGHQAQGCQVAPQELSGALGAVLMADAVKAIAPDALLEPLIRSWINDRFHGELAVKGGIKDCYLRHTRQDLLNRLDVLQVQGIMQGVNQ